MTPITQATPSQIALHQARMERMARIKRRSQFCRPVVVYEAAIGPKPPRPVGPKTALKAVKLSLRARKLRVREIVGKYNITIIKATPKRGKKPKCIIAEEAPAKPKKIKKLRDIAREVCEEFDISLLEMVSPKRTKHLVIARHKAIWRMKTETAHSLPAIGRFLNRDHTTILHAISKHQERLDAGEVV